jgi:hypothetical protein
MRFSVTLNPSGPNTLNTPSILSASSSRLRLGDHVHGAEAFIREQGVAP